ncbi:MAG: hypothetical protein RLZZ232_662 [Planctomycetota bacterium]|jgi:serine/threonine-protein kinase
MQDDEQELDGLIAEFLTAVESGKQPDAMGWMVRNPRHAAEFAVFLRDLSRLDGIAWDRSLSGSGPESCELPRVLRGSAAEVVDFGDYELVGAPLGVGGMGVVYRARLKGTRVEVALKRLQGASSGAGRRIAEEIEAAALLRHPHIVPVYHAGEHRGEPYFTMALIEGGPLGQYLGELRRDRRFAAQLMAKVARAVHFAHQRRILHRDLKPSNILLDEHREPHVADFGLAEPLTESGLAQRADRQCGSLPWMAPEILREESAVESGPSFSRLPDVTTAVDIWALGVILYEVLTGERPFRGETPQQLREAILSHSPIPPREVDATIPRDLEALCLRCLEKSPARRYESASAVALELDRWLRDEPVRARQASAGERLLRWCRRAPGTVALLVTGTMGLLILMLGLFPLMQSLRQQVIAQMSSTCEHQAQHVAGNVAKRLDVLRNTVRVTAEALSRKSLSGSHVSGTWPKNAVPDWLKQSLCRLEKTPVDPVVEAPFHGAFLLDDKGWLVFHSEEGNPVKNKPYDFRNYFQVVSAMSTGDGAASGDGGRTSEVSGNLISTMGVQGINNAGRSVYVSHAYHSDLDNTDKVALATKVRFEGSPREYVLAATLRTAQRLQLGTAEMSNSEITAILVAPLDRNPDGTAERQTADQSGETLRQKAERQQVEYGILMHPGMDDDAGMMLFPKNADGTPAIEPQFATRVDYRDPMGHVDSRYAGRWVLAFARVENTDLYVGVQANVDKAIAPFSLLLERIGILLLVAVGAGGLVFGGALWLRHRNSAKN